MFQMNRENAKEPNWRSIIYFYDVLLPSDLVMTVHFTFLLLNKSFNNFM